MKISLLVVLYNRELTESETLKSLANLDIKLGKQDNTQYQLVVWNNGPTKLANYDLSAWGNNGYDCHYEESISNIPLSKIYNRFIENYPSDKYILLDHDSSLNNQYLIDAEQIDDLLLLPKITSNDQLCSPGKLPAENGRYRPTQKLAAITSGMVLSDQLVTTLKQKYKTPFDEHYAFYGIDTSFMLRIKQIASCNKITVISGFNHSLSKNEQESQQVKEFRAREMAISVALTTRHYPSISSYKRFIKSVINAKKGKNSYPIKEMFDAYRSGYHPKCKQS